MSTELPKLHPIKFPSVSPTGKARYTVHTLESKKGKSTKEIIAEVKRLSKKDLFPSK